MSIETARKLMDAAGNLSSLPKILANSMDGSHLEGLLTPDETREVMALTGEHMLTSGLVEEYVKVVDHHMSEADMLHLIELYQDEVFQRFVQNVQPKLVTETVMMSMRYAETSAFSAMEEWAKSHPSCKKASLILEVVAEWREENEVSTCPKK